MGSATYTKKSRYRNARKTEEIRIQILEPAESLVEERSYIEKVRENIEFIKMYALKYGISAPLIYHTPVAIRQDTRKSLYFGVRLKSRGGGLHQFVWDIQQLIGEYIWSYDFERDLGFVHRLDNGQQLAQEYYDEIRIVSNFAMH